MTKADETRRPNKAAAADGKIAAAVLSVIWKETMKKTTISRKDLKEKLLQWQEGRMTAHELHDWAEKNYLNDDVEYDDWDVEENCSVTNEVLSDLDKMDMNLMTLEDIPAYLDFLETPPSSFEEGYNKLQQYLEQIDIRKRTAALVADPFYERFCR